MPKGNRNETAPAGMNNAIKLTALEIAWTKAGFHMTDRRYRQIAKEGRVPEPVMGYVDALKCLIQLCLYYQNMSEGRGDSTHEEIKKRRDIEKLAMEEMERKRMEGGLIDRATVADELVKRVHVLKSDLLGLPKRLAKWQEAKDIAAKYINHVLKTYARKTGSFSD